jgi:hypothetical protein
MLRHFTLASVSLAGLGAAAWGQSFVYPDFSSTAGLELRSYSASQPPTQIAPPGVVGTAIRITSATLSQRGAVWYEDQVQVAGGFDTTFSYSISGQTSGGADGLALVIHNDARGVEAIGRHASALGYGAFASPLPGDAIENALVIELDTFQTAGGTVNDPNDSHVAVLSGGSGDCLANHTTHGLAVHMDSQVGANGTRSVRVQYIPGTLNVYFVDLVVPKISIPYHFSTGGALSAGGTVGGLNLTGGRAWIGFTASTGGSAENHDLVSWSWSSTLLTVPYCFGDGTGTGCPCGNTGASGRGCGNGTPSGGGLLASSGSISVSAADLVLLGSGLQPNQPGLYFQGNNATNGGNGFVNGDGLRCAGGGIRRLQIVAANPAGASGTSVNIALQGLVNPGDVRRYQLWYRNPLNSPCATTFNLTNGLEVTWGP